MNNRTDRDAPELPFELLDEAPGPARPLAPGAADRLIAGAMARAAVSRPSARVISLPPRRRRKVVALAGAAVLCGATAAAAHHQGWLQPLLSSWTTPTQSAPPAPPKQVEARPHPQVPKPPARLEAMPEPEPPAVAPEAPSTTHATAPPRARQAKPRWRASKARQARDLLREANSLRSQQRYQAAAQKYLKLVQDTPNSPEAQPARVAAATLLLEHLHQPQRAEGLFAEAERRGGELAPEAAFGVAEARRARDDRAGELEQLRKLVQQYPNSTLATLARQRLDARQRLGSTGSQ